MGRSSRLGTYGIVGAVLFASLMALPTTAVSATATTKRVKADLSSDESSLSPASSPFSMTMIDSAVNSLYSATSQDGLPRSTSLSAEASSIYAMLQQLSQSAAFDVPQRALNASGLQLGFTGNARIGITNAYAYYDWSQGGSRLMTSWDANLLLHTITGPSTTVDGLLQFTSYTTTLNWAGWDDVNDASQQLVQFYSDVNAESVSQPNQAPDQVPSDFAVYPITATWIGLQGGVNGVCDTCDLLQTGIVAQTGAELDGIPQDIPTLWWEYVPGSSSDNCGGSHSYPGWSSGGISFGNTVSYSIAQTGQGDNVYFLEAYDDTNDNFWATEIQLTNLGSNCPELAAYNADYVVEAPSLYESDNGNWVIQQIADFSPVTFSDSGFCFYTSSGNLQCNTPGNGHAFQLDQWNGNTDNTNEAVESGDPYVSYENSDYCFPYVYDSEFTC